MQPSPPKTTSILPEPPAPTKAKQGAHGRLIALVTVVAGVLLVAGVVTIAIVLTTTGDGKKSNSSDTLRSVAGAYAAAFASSPPLTVATYDSCAQLLAARESSGPLSRAGRRRQRARAESRRSGRPLPEPRRLAAGRARLRDG